MSTVVIQRVAVPPEDILLYPDYLLCFLMAHGVGKTEPVWDGPLSQTAEWTYTSHISRQVLVIAACPLSSLRTIFARFAYMLGINPYCGHILFNVKFADAEEPEHAQFSLFLCNEPTMDIWLKLYYYRSPLQAKQTRA